jgi:hypothetical protein
MRLFPGHPLVPAADLVAVTMSGLAVGHRVAARSGLDIDGVTWTIPGAREGLAPPPAAFAAAPGPLSREAALMSIDHRARRADPREHGRQAARSERDRPSGPASRTTN